MLELAPSRYEEDDVVEVHGAGDLVEDLAWPVVSLDEGLPGGGGDAAAGGTAGDGGDALPETVNSIGTPGSSLGSSSSGSAGFSTMCMAVPQPFVQYEPPGGHVEDCEPEDTPSLLGEGSEEELVIRTFSRQVQQLQTLSTLGTTAASQRPVSTLGPPKGESGNSGETVLDDDNLAAMLRNAGCPGTTVASAVSGASSETAEQCQSRWDGLQGPLSGVLGEPLRLWRARNLYFDRLNRLDLEEVSALKTFTWSRGNCQFVSVSYLLWGTPERHKEVREAAVLQMLAQPERYRAFVPEGFQSFALSMAAPGAWGDLVTLLAIADAYSVDINVVSATTEHDVLYFGPENVKGTMALWLSFFAAHYKPLQSRQHPEACGGQEGSGQCVVA